MKKQLNRFNLIKTGLLIVCLAISFIYDRGFFFYPPELAPMWNNLAVDVIGLLTGISLVVCGLFEVKVDLIVKTSLGVAVAYLTVLLVADGFHVWGAGYFRFHPDMLLELYAVVNLMQLAYEYEPNEIY